MYILKFEFEGSVFYVSAISISQCGVKYEFDIYKNNAIKLPAMLAYAISKYNSKMEVEYE